MIKEIETLIEDIKDDYAKFMAPVDDVSKQMNERFRSGVSVKEGRKYIKILTDRSVWGFVVNTDNDNKFKRGDILMAAGYNAPARNHPRGNIFGKYSVSWTGPHYIGDGRLL
jgi:hypothetical protein